MKKFLTNICFFCIATITISSCSSKNEEGKLIPSTAMYVSVMDLNSMNKELTWDEIKNSGWFQIFSKSTYLPDWTKKVLGTPEVSGIDFDQNLVMFANKNAAGKFYWIVQGSLKNQRDFDQFNKEYSNAGEIKKTGHVSMLLLSKNNLVGWNESHFIYMASKMPEYRLDMPDTIDQTPTLTLQEMMDECVSIFQLEKDQSLAKNKRFSSLLKEKADIKFWLNGEKIMKDNPASGLGNMLNTDVFFKNNISTFAIQFNEGEININQRQYASEKFTEYLKENIGSKVDMELIKKLPSKDLLGLLSINVKPEAFENLIKLSGADGLANMFLQKAGFNLEDVTKANDGSLLIAISDATINPEIKEGENNNSSDKVANKPAFEGIFAIGVKDKPSFQKIFDGAQSILEHSKLDSTLHLKLTDKIMAASNSQAYVSQFLINQSANDFPLLNKDIDHPLVGFLDLQKIISLVKTSGKTSAEGDEMIRESLQMWKGITMKGGEIKDEAVQIHYTINLVDKNTNSLRQLNNYFYALSQLQKKMREKAGSGRNVDSLLLPPLPDTVRITDTSKI